MVHPTDSELVALVHRELAVPQATEVRAHLASCEPCQARYRALAQEDGQVASLLVLLDAPVPTVPLATILRRAHYGRRARPVAAAIAALLAAATAAATVIPGSPLHPFFRNVVGRPTLQTRPALPPAPAPADSAGVTVPADTEVTIALRDPQSAGRIRLLWQADAPALSVRAIGGEVGYTVRMGRVLVENRRPAVRYEITLPYTVPAVTLMVGDQVLWRSSRAADPGQSRQPITFDLSQTKQRVQ